MRSNVIALDLEVSPNYFLIGMKLLKTGKVLQIDTKTILTKDQRGLFGRILSSSTLITFNGVRYDMPIVHKVMCDVTMTTKDIFEMSQRMIGENIPPYRVYNEFDIEPYRGVDHIDVSEPSPGVFVSLKGYGARLHSQKLQDLPYAYDKVLTDEEIEVIRKYNINDLDTTIDLYTAIKPRIVLREEMSEQYSSDLRSKSDAQIAETVIVKELTKAGVRVSKASVPATVKYIAPKCVEFHGSMILKQLLKRVQEEEFKINQKNGAVVLPDWLKKYPLEMNGTKYQIGIGGLHSKEKKLVCEPEEGYVMRNIDVEAYYPSMILEFGFYPPRFTDKFMEVYGELYTRRMTAKHEQKRLEKRIKELRDELSSM